ncbi:MAG TPA: nucleoside kinase [Candidatus Avilachnospira avicola]|nr:nucleoside kinase [Candidatus Avilachnospira avicola]
MKISCKGDQREFERGTKWSEIARAFSEKDGKDVLLVHDLDENRLIELYKSCKSDKRVEFLTYEDPAGRMTYARSAIFMMLKAFYEVCGFENVERVSVKFTIGGNFYVVPTGSFELDPILLSKVSMKMHAYADAAMPIRKISISVDKAIRRFRKYRMYDKSELFRYRRVSRVNVYELEGFVDYFYGAMCPDTSYVKKFMLEPYKEGFMLILPSGKDPEKLSDFHPSEKLFRVQSESFGWAEKIGIDTIADLNRAICEGRANDLILMQEAYFEKSIGEIAQRISRKDKKFILLSGPSSAGKTTTANRIAIQLRAYGLNPHIISVDNYFKGIADRKLDEFGRPDFESLDAVDTEQFNSDMLRLLNGERVEIPSYNFITGEREYKGNFIELRDEDVLVIEGIHCLNEKFSEKLPSEYKYKVYISALTMLNIDEHNRIPTTDMRLLRRMVRDSRTRGYSAAQTINRWPDVRKGEEENIFPYQDQADVILNTSMIYELAVIKSFAEPLLFGISQDAPEYIEAKRLLKFLDYVLPLSPETVPGTSIVREFIGGSLLDVG